MWCGLLACIEKNQAFSPAPQFPFIYGSVFKNPPNNHAGKLIEASGLKGTRQGGATISQTHANFIINENNATFGDIYQLIQQAINTVQHKFKILLEEEVRIIR